MPARPGAMPSGRRIRSGKLLSSAEDGTAGPPRLGPGIHGSVTAFEDPDPTFTAWTSIAMQDDGTVRGLSHGPTDDGEVTCSWDIPLDGTRDG